MMSLNYVDMECDIDSLLNEYSNYCLYELTYYSTSDTKKLLQLFAIGQKLGIIEKILFDKYYTNYAKLVLDDITDSNIFYLQKIFYSITNLIIKMTMLISLSHEKIGVINFQYKSVYITGYLEYYITKIIIPIKQKLKNIINSNKIFKFEYEISYLKKFADENKNKFSSKEKADLLNILLNILDDK